jgi:hypothetical protein
MTAQRMRHHSRMSEADEQIAAVRWCRDNGIPVFHVPNEARRSYGLARRLKDMGMSPGVPDLCIPVPAHGYHGLFIEMKYGRNKPTESQEKWLSLLSGSGYRTAVCWSSDEAIGIIRAHVSA